MVAIRSIDEIATKWAKVTPERAPYYESGIKAPKADWATEAKDGQKAYDTAMADPKVRARREKGITKVGTEKWSRKAIAVGPDRFRTGVAAAEPDFREGFGPYQGVIAAWIPPERGPRGDPKNYDIVKSIGSALHKKRVGGS